MPKIEKVEYGIIALLKWETRKLIEREYDYWIN